MKRSAAIGVAVVLALGLGACGSSGDGAATASTDGERLTATTPSTEATTTTTTPSVAKLQGLLLTPADVGPGWAISPPSGDSADASDFPDCLAGLDQLSPDRATAEVEYGKPGGEYFGESIEYAGPDAIADEFAAAKALFDGCGAISLDVGGTMIAGTMAPVVLTAGDMSAAYEMTFTVSGVTLTMYLGIVGVDGYEMTTWIGQIDDADRSTFDQLTHAAVDRVRSGGGATA